MANIIDKIVSWFTKGAYGSPIEYTNPVKCVNPTSNLDYLYGPYKLPEGVNEPTLETIPDDLRLTLYPGKTFGIEKNGKIIEYWAQLKDRVVESADFNFETAVNIPENYDLIVKQCVDVEEITPNLISVDKSSIDALFDDDETNPTLGSEWQPLPGEEQGQTGGTEE